MPEKTTSRRKRTPRKTTEPVDPARIDPVRVDPAPVDPVPAKEPVRGRLLKMNGSGQTTAIRADGTRVLYAWKQGGVVEEERAGDLRHLNRDTYTEIVRK